jgi:hypothetical protein
MRSVQEVLSEKEIDLARVRQEIAALRCVAPMLADENEPPRLEPVRRDALRVESAPSVTELPRLESGTRNRWPLDVR